MRVILSAVFGLHEGERYRRLEHLLQRNLALRTGRVGTLMLFLPPLRRDLGHLEPRRQGAAPGERNQVAAAAGER
jgi:hypothetical protein